MLDWRGSPGRGINNCSRLHCCCTTHFVLRRIYDKDVHTWWSTSYDGLSSPTIHKTYFLCLASRMSLLISYIFLLAPNTHQTWWQCSGKRMVWIIYHESGFTWPINTIWKLVYNLKSALSTREMNHVKMLRHLKSIMGFRHAGTSVDFGQLNQ